MVCKNRKLTTVRVLAENKHVLMFHGLRRGSCFYLPANMVNINTPVERIRHSRGLFIWMVFEGTFHFVQFSSHLWIHRNRMQLNYENGNLFRLEKL